MNERIKLLAEQAGMHFDKYNLAFADNNHAEDGVDLEKFAKLLIRECVKHITDQQALVETNWQCKAGIHSVYSLKEHFGVKE